MFLKLLACVFWLLSLAITHGCTKEQEQTRLRDRLREPEAAASCTCDECRCHERRPRLPLRDEPDDQPDAARAATANDEPSPDAISSRETERANPFRHYDSAPSRPTMQFLEEF